MATIKLWEEYNSKARKFGITDSDRFRSSFVDAVNLTYADLNAEVFEGETLAFIKTNDDIIDERLISFAVLTYDAGAGDSLPVMSEREFWSSEWDLERTHDTNGLTDTIAQSGGDPTITLSIANGVFTVTTDAGTPAITASATLPDVTSAKVKFTSSSGGNALTVNGDAVALTYTNGAATTTLPLVTITSRIMTGVTGYTLNRIAFNSPATKLVEFLLNDGADALTDEIEGYGATLSGTAAVWETVYIEPSSTLDSQYKSVFNDCVNYYLQEGGEWSIEPEPDAERKWLRAIKRAKKINQNNTTYVNPLGI